MSEEFNAPEDGAKQVLGKHSARPFAYLDDAAVDAAIANEAALAGGFADDDAFSRFGDDDEDDDGSRTYMQNRELSWLTFNERVLDQGADESVPLLERLNFISIFWSNLQEFFMVRVGSLADLSFIEPPAIDSKTGMTPDDQIRAIHERCHELYPIQESTYEHVRGQLAKEGVRHLRPEDLSEEQRNYLFGLVRHNIEPFLSPQIINARHPFPHLENGKLYILVRLDDEASAAERKKRKKKKDKDKSKKEKGGAEGVVLGLIPLPHQCERVIKLPGRGYQFILLEHAIEMFVPEIFSMYRIKHTNVICVTRNADIDANQGFDEQDEDYREHMKRLLKKRARLAPVRLECERPLSPVMEKVMLKKLGLKRFQMYDTIVPLDLGFTWGLGSRLTEKKRARLSNPPFTPAWPTCFDRTRRIIDQVSERDVLLSYPYESMDPFVQLLREAANDPDVISIKITLYRLASQSHLAEALIAAADAGKEVTALFELRARFDENNNIEWSQRFEQAGCNVLYGFRNYKVHSKICCITRRMPDGSIQHITQLGTGNYNEKTARLYTDFSFITIDEAFGRDAVEFFRNMQLENVSDNYDVLRVAPLQIKEMLLDNLDRQIALARAGRPAYAFMKANSVTDKDVIEKISEASNAGVRITLFIRGICCLIPRVAGATDNVRVVSIVGRLLEHSRIYCFGTADDCTVYLSSADLMTRNLNKRVEIAWPLPGGEIRDKVLAYIDVCMHDTAKLRELRPNATYTPLGAFCDLDEDGNPEPSFDAQAALIEYAAQAELGAGQAAPAGEGEDEQAGVDEPIAVDGPAEEGPAEHADVPTETEDAGVTEAAPSLTAGAAVDPESPGQSQDDAPEPVALVEPAVEALPFQDLDAFGITEAPVDAPVQEEEEAEKLTDLTVEEILFPTVSEQPMATQVEQVSKNEAETGSPSEPAVENLAVQEAEPAAQPEPVSELDEQPEPVSEPAVQPGSFADALARLEPIAEPSAVSAPAREADVVVAAQPQPEPDIASSNDLSAELLASLQPMEDANEARPDTAPDAQHHVDPTVSEDGIPVKDGTEISPAIEPEPPLASLAIEDLVIEPVKLLSEDAVQDAPQSEQAPSDRVSELLAQLSAASGQDVPIQEIPLQTLQALQPDHLAQDGESAAFAPHAQREGDSRASAESAGVTAVDSTEAASEPAATVTEPASEGDEARPDNAHGTDFFDGPGRELEMPPTKKGLFSRLRGN